MTPVSTMDSATGITTIKLARTQNLWGLVVASRVRSCGADTPKPPWLPRPAQRLGKGYKRRKKKLTISDAETLLLELCDPLPPYKISLNRDKCKTEQGNEQSYLCA